MTKHSGFTLIEVLVAMIVLAIGLLGFAGLQATALRNNQSAYHRSQATQLAYDLADRVRANVSGRATYTTIDPGDATAKSDCLSTTGCSPADMAENDLFEWNSELTSNLPSGTGTIAVAGSVFTITINWDDNRDGVVEVDGDDPDPNFQTSFQL